MRRLIATIASALALIATAAAAQPVTSADRPIVYVGLFEHDAERQPTGYAAKTGERAGDDLAGLLFVSPCGRFGAAGPSRPLSSFATEAWRMSGRVLEISDQEASVQIGWQRLRRAGHEANAGEQSVTLTLKRNERHVIEHIAVPGSTACETRAGSLAVIFTSRGDLDRSAKAAAVPTSTKASTETMPPAASGFATAELWLVRTRTGSADEAQRTDMHLLPTALPYAFSPLTIETSTATLSVTVAGTIEAGRAPDGLPQLHFTATRAVAPLTTVRPASSAPLIEGSTKTTIAFPGPEEVVAFEMPPLRAPDGTTLPDRFSVRLRVTLPASR